MPDGQYYALTFTSIDYANRIFLNGQQMQSVGSPGDSADTAVPLVTSVYYTVLPLNGMIEVFHQVSNFVHKEGGMPTGLYVGSIESVSRYHSRQTQATSLTMGGCILLFVVHMALYLLLRIYRTNFYFAIFCLVCFFRIGVTGPKILVSMFPDLSWNVSFRVEYMSIPSAALLLMLALGEMFPGLIHRRVKNASIVAMVLCTLFFCFAPTVLMTHALPYVFVIVYLLAAYVLVRFLLLFKKERSTEKIIVLCGLVVFLYLSVRDMLYHSDIMIFPAVHSSTLDLAFITIILFQMTASFSGTMKEVAAALESEQRLAMENAALNRVSRLRTEMMTTISHELKTPLAVMMGYAQLTASELRDKGADEQTTADLDAIATESKRLAQLVERLSSVSLYKTGDARGIAVADVIQQIARLYEPILLRKNIALKLIIEDSLPLVCCTPDELTQILFCLIHNADRHGNADTVTINAAADGEFVSISVADTGDGIPSGLLPQVFERGVSGEQGGTGLGLFICREIAEAYDGQIDVQSEPEHGTNVTLRLPVWRNYPR